MTTHREGGPEAFCRRILEQSTHGITWLGMDGYVQLDDDRRAHVVLATDNPYARYPTAGDYTSIVVSIVSKTRGLIQRKVFVFDDYLHERKDDRTDYPIAGNTTFQVVDHCGWDWYIAVPTSTTPLVQAIDTFLDMFR